MRIKLSGTEEQIEVMEKCFVDDLGLLSLLGKLEITVNFDEYKPNHGFQNYTIVFDKQGFMKKEWISVAEIFVRLPFGIISELKEGIDAILKNPEVKNKISESLMMCATNYRDYFFNINGKFKEELIALSYIFCYPTNFLIEIKQAISIKPTK